MALDNTQLVRLLITDTGTGTDQLFTDEQITAFLGMYGDNVNRAAAKALLVIAASEVLVSKKIRTQDLSTDGPAVSQELRALAAALRAEADAEAADEGAFFDIIPNSAGWKPEAAEWRLP